MKLLNGSDLAGFIKERQARQVRALRQASKIVPKLAIVMTGDNPASTVYVRMKKQYAADIYVDVDIHHVDQAEVPTLIESLNHDELVHGIIVQLPLADQTQTDEILNLVAPEKDVDALGQNATLDPATPLAILWLLAGYNIELKGKNIVLVGRGKLVGAPLERMLLQSGITPSIVTSETQDMEQQIQAADVIVTATGVAGLVRADMIKQGAVVVDAGVAGEQGKIVGDLAPDVYARDDLIITPAKGGVGPLTICALFDNVIRVARATEQED